MSTAYPSSWAECGRSLIGECKLTVAGYETTVELNARQLDRVYLPILALLTRQSEASENRVLAGLAGVGGGGKSTFVAILQVIADHILPMGSFVSLGMDGWHWPNHILDARRTINADGRNVSLRERKGGPASFDVQSLIDTLRRLYQGGAPVTIPIYDRQTHNPIPNAQTIPNQSRIILIEGNYILGGVEEQPEWGDVAKLLHPTFFLDCDPMVARDRMILRHIRGGSSPEEADRKYERNDRLNAEIICRSGRRADYVIYLGPEARLESRLT